MTEAQTTARKLRDFARDMQRMADVFDERVALKNEAIARLTWIFGDDTDLAETVYAYVMRGHLSYHNELRERFRHGCHGRDKAAPPDIVPDTD